VAAFEVMLMNPAIGNLIRKGETHKIQSTIQTSRRFGMVTLDDYLLDMVQRGVVTAEVAIESAQNRDDLAARLG
jgi:twitching motility protein PilT